MGRQPGESQFDGRLARFGAAAAQGQATSIRGVPTLQTASPRGHQIADHLGRGDRAGPIVHRGYRLGDGRIGKVHAQ